MSGTPKVRGPQGASNRGDAGKKKAFSGLPPIGKPQRQQQRPQPMDIPPVTGPVPITEKPSSEPSLSVSGFFKHAAKDVSEFVAAPLVMAKVAWEAGLDIVKNIKYADGLFRHPELMARELDNTWRSVIKSIVEPYKDGYGMALYKHPLTTLLDATVVFDVLGGGMKVAAKAGVKASGRTGIEAVKALAQDRMWRLGDSIQTAPGRMFAKPFQLAGQGLMKIPQVATAARKFGVTPVGADVARIIGSHKQFQRAAAALPVETLFKNKIPKAEWELFDDIVNGVQPISKATSPAMKERIEFWRGWNQEFEHSMVDLGLRTTEAMESAVLGQTAIRLSEKGHLKAPLREFVEGKEAISKAALDEAKAWRDGANPFKEATNPVYRPWTHERSFDIAEFIDALQQGEGSGKYLQFNSRMERRTGQKAVTLDPDFWTARSAFQRSEALAGISAYQDVITKYGKPMKGGKALPGHVIVPPIFKKYTGEGLVNAVDLLTQKMKEKEALARVAGGDRAKAVAMGIKETRDELLATAKEMQENLIEAARDKNWAIQIPEDAAYVLQKSFIGPRGFWRFYDNVLDTWRDMLLTLMPRYYINNLLGNAVLLTFAGHNPMTKLAALKRDDLPGEALGSMYLAEGGEAGSYLARPFERQQRPVRRLANRFADLTDNTAKQAYVATAAAEVIERQAMLENVAAQGLYTLENVQQQVEKIAKARKRMLEMPLEELRATKRLRAQMEGESVKLTQAQQDLGAATLSEMRQIQHNINTTRDLSRLDPEKGARQIKELIEQLKLKAKELEALDPNLLIEKMPEFRNAPEVEDLARIKLQQAELAPFAGMMESAVREMENWFGNYGRLHPLERNVIRRVIPFWTFSSTMFKLLYQLPFIRPKTSFLFNRFAKFLLDGIGEDVPDRLKYALPLGGDENGYIMFVNIRGLNPLEMAGKWTSFGEVPIPKVIDPTNNPFIKVGVESIGGYDTLIEKPFTKKTDFVALDGRVLRYDPDTAKIEQIIPQKPIVQSILGQIPYMKMMDEILVGTGLLDEGKMGTPSGRGPDGSIMYHRHWLQGIARWMGASTTIQNPEKIRLQQMLQKRSMNRRLRALAQRSDPETRIQAERILNELEFAEFEQ